MTREHEIRILEEFFSYHRTVGGYYLSDLPKWISSEDITDLRTRGLIDVPRGTGAFYLTPKAYNLLDSLNGQASLEVL